MDLTLTKVIAVSKGLNSKNHLLKALNSAQNLFVKKLDTSEMVKKEIKGLVSIVLPVFNVERYIKKCLESIAAQDDESFELIVVDDGSTDSSIEIVKKYLDSFKKIKIHKQNNLGLGGARNTGVRLSVGEYITFVDSDDIISAKYVSALRRGQAEGNYDVVSGKLELISDKGEKLKADGRQIPNLNPEILTHEAILGAFTYSVACGRLYRASFLKNSGIIFLEKIPHEDLFYTYKVLKKAQKTAVIPETIYFWRQREGSISKSITARHIEVLPLLRKDTQDFLMSNFAHKREYVFAAHRNIKLLAYFRNKVSSYGDNDIFNMFMGMVRQNERYILNDCNLLNVNMLSDSNNIVDRANKILNEAKVNGINRLNGQGQKSANIDIAFFPLRAYHLNDCLPVANLLRQQGVRVEIIETDCWRDGNDEVLNAAHEQNIEIISFNEFLSQSVVVSCVVMWNDWDLIMRIVAEACHAVRTETVAWVEGIQDYHEVDRGNKRYPYLRSKHVILPGKFDRRYFKNTGQVIYEGEIVRIGLLWENRDRGKLKPSSKKVLINSNFSYGVLVEHRDAWVDSAVEACLACGFEPVISRHPFDKGETYFEYTTKKSFFDAISECEVSIQRFASGVLEALAMGVPVIYFNPHGEKVDKFISPNGAYLLTNDRRELDLILREHRYYWHETSAIKFLELHAGLSSQGRRAGDVMCQILKKILNDYKSASTPLVNKLNSLPPSEKKTVIKNKALKIGPFYGCDVNNELVCESAKKTVGTEGLQSEEMCLAKPPREIEPIRSNLTIFELSLEALAYEIADDLLGQYDDTLKISVIIPCFNAATHIVPCLESLARQTLPSHQFEVICIDDCSTDETIELIQSYQDRISNLRLIKHETNKKQGAARNTGMRNAQGSYITFIDCDDFLRIDALEILFNTAAGSELVVAQHVFVRYDKPFKNRGSNRHIKSTLKRSAIDGSLGWWPFGMLISRSLLEKHAIQFREGVFYEDIDFVIRLTYAASACIVTKEKIYYYVQRDNSTLNSINEKKILDAVDAISVVFNLLRDATSKEKEIFSSRANNWLKLQAERIWAGTGGTTEKIVLTKFYVSALEHSGLFELVGEPLRNQIEFKVTETPPVVESACPNYQYLPWGEAYEDTFRGKVVFFCEVDYHIRSAVSIVRAMSVRGIDSIIVDASRSTTFTANRPLDVEEEKLYSDVNILKVNVADSLPFATDAAAFVFMNDLTYTKQLIFENFGFDVPTFGFYEGINDDWNIDRKALRRPYRSCDYLLLPGLYQKGFYRDRTSWVVGLPNVQRRLVEEYVRPTERLAVINVNFTYNVLEECRDEFVDTAVMACEAIGLKYVISQHPSDKGDLSRFNVSSQSIYDLITQGSILISRFSTTILEALAMGRPVVYHNPIGERVPKFMHPLGAFSKSHSLDSLKKAISNELSLVAQGVDIRQRAELFLHFHCNTAGVHEPDSMAADIIADVLASPRPRLEFKKTLLYNSSKLPISLTKAVKPLALNLSPSVPVSTLQPKIVSASHQSLISNGYLSDHEISLQKANLLMQSMRIEDAMKIYLRLFFCEPMTDISKIYEFNALLAARKLGYKEITSAESLRHHLGLN